MISNRMHHDQSSLHSRSMLCVALLACWLSGCAGQQMVRVRPTPENPLEQVLQLSTRSGPTPSARTLQVLRQYDLSTGYFSDPQPALEKLAAINGDSPQEEICYALAELSYVGAAKVELTNNKRAMDLYWNCVLHSHEYLFAPCFGDQRNPYDPHFRRACDLYNASLEKCLRSARKAGSFKPGKTFECLTTNGPVEVAISPRGFGWEPDDFDRFEFVSDYQIAGLVNHYRTYGLGVPLIAIRAERNRAEPTERFYCQDLSFPVTAFLRLHPAANGKPGVRAELELIDPLQTAHVEVNNLRVPLESDLSTPLAYFLDHMEENDTSTFGLLRPDKVEKLSGLYMVQPYQPGKIPVVMVHGLWSSPMTWMEMFNDLRSRPEIRDRYQFWFYLYPTGQPFWNSAARLREELVEVRSVFDPGRKNPAFDEMVLVGHSMGGLISRMVSVDSGNQFWDVLSAKPFEELKARNELKQNLEHVFFFPANPSIKRVISIASPHRGSDFSNDITQWLARNVITLPGRMVMGREEILRDNPGVFRQPELVKTQLTSIDSLSPKCPMLDALRLSQKPAWVEYHNMVGIQGNAPLEKQSDGIVPYTSAHLDDVASEIIVPSDHSNVHRHPLAILEVRRILLEHYVNAGPAIQSHLQQQQTPGLEVPHASFSPGVPYAPGSIGAPNFYGPAPYDPATVEPGPVEAIPPGVMVAPQQPLPQLPADMTNPAGPIGPFPLRP